MLKNQNWIALLDPSGILFLWVESVFFVLLLITIFCRKNRYQDRVYVAKKRKRELLDLHPDSPVVVEFVHRSGPDKIIKTYRVGYKRRKLELRAKERRAMMRRRRSTSEVGGQDRRRITYSEARDRRQRRSSRWIEEVDGGFEVSLNQRYREARQMRRDSGDEYLRRFFGTSNTRATI